MFALCVCGGGDDPVFCSVCLSFPGHGRLRSLGGGGLTGLLYVS